MKNNFNGHKYFYRNWVDTNSNMNIYTYNIVYLARIVKLKESLTLRWCYIITKFC